MDKKRKTRYLNKTILVIMTIGYSAFLILMLLMDWYLIRNFQLKNQQAEQEVLNTYIQKTQNSMEKIERQLSEIYTSNQDFQALQKTQREVTEYSHVYELKESLKKRMVVDENLSGFYIFYNDMQKVWYQVNTEKINEFYTKQLKESLQQRLELGIESRTWMVISVEENTYLTVCYQTKKTAVVGIYSMENLDAVILEGMGKNAEIVLIENDLVKKNSKLAEKLELVKTVNEYENHFCTVIGNEQVYGQRVSNMNFWICVIYPITIWNLVNIQQIILLILTAISIVAVIIMNVFVRKNVTKPLNQLIGTMNRIRVENTEEVPELDCVFYELIQVNTTLGDMVHELKKQKMLVYEEIIEKQKAQMQYLQLQLKPHFYLNGLKTLNALALQNQTDKMQELILNLSVHLRYLLQAERKLVQLREELKFVQNYVDLQKHISGRPVICEVMKDEYVEEWQVPTLVLQTFVENSIKYARLGSSSIPLEIQITVSRLQTEKGEFLDLIIQDNGQGYPESLLNDLNEEPKEGSTAVGINNIKRRCRLLYGSEVEYSFANIEGAYSELIIPDIR